MSTTPFIERYGPWAIVAGASEGLGASFAEALAARKLNVVLVARRAELTETLAAKLRAAHGVETRVVGCDLSDAAFGDTLAQATRDLAVGLGVYNAAYSFVAPLLDNWPYFKSEFLRPIRFPRHPLRLAKFGSRVQDKRYFEGLPSPSAAAVRRSGRAC